MVKKKKIENNPDNNNLKITLAICFTVLVIFFSYQFYFSSFATCVRSDMAQKEMKYKFTNKDKALINSKKYCSRNG